MAKKKPAKKAAAAKKKTAKRTSTTKKAAAKSPRKAAKPARKAAGKAAGKQASRKAAKKAAPKAAARKAAPKAAAKKAAVRKVATQKAAAKAAARAKAPKQVELALEDNEPTGPTVETERPGEEVVETTSAGIQPLAPEHAAVDDLTSSGNELLDIFQKYDRNRTGSIEQAGFARLLEALGQNITDEELAIAFDIIDTERTGKISWKQFKNWWTSR